MPSSLFSRARIRVLDAVLLWLRRPNRIDPLAVVSPTAQVTESSLHGPVRVEEHARIHGAELFGDVRVGRYSSLWGPEIYVLARGNPIEIGNFCSIARQVSLHGYLHDAARISTHYVGRNVLGLPIEDEVVSRGPISVGHDVWMGVGVQVMSGVTIGTGAVIGAGSIVTRDVPQYAVAVGAPARVVRFRFEEAVVARLLASEWWAWDAEEIRRKAKLFTQPLTLELMDEHLG